MKKLLATFFILCLFTQPALAATDVKNDATLSTNLVSYWELEEASGTRVDSHGSNDLTDNNTVGQATGIQGNAADFEDTNSEALTITDASQSGLDITGNISVSVWVKYETLPSGDSRVLVGKDDGTNRSYFFFVNDQGGGNVLLTMRVRDGSNNRTFLDTTVTPTTGVWYHYVVALDMSVPSGEIYENGSPTSATFSFSDATSIVNSSADFNIGGPGTGSDYFDGLIDEVGIWSKELTSTEVSDLYNSGSGIPYDGGGAARRIIRTTQY